jgi:large subunit ribosomal protein L29
VRARELRTLTREELEQRLREAREELFNLKFQHKTGQLGNPLRIREVRKDIVHKRRAPHPPPTAHHRPRGRRGRRRAGRRGCADTGPVRRE